MSGVNQDCCLLRLLWLFGFRCQVSGVNRNASAFTNGLDFHPIGNYTDTKEYQPHQGYNTEVSNGRN